MARGISESPKVVRLPNILAEVLQGKIQIPRFQRLFVWEDEQRLRLLESIYRGFPIGSFMLWQSTQKMEVYDKIGRYPLQREKDPKAYHYLMDGLQRLATLFDAFPYPAALESDEKDSAALSSSDAADAGLESRLRPIYIDLHEKKENPFKFLPARDSCPDYWIQTDQLLSQDRYREVLRRLWKANLDNEAARVEEIRDLFLDYSVPIIYYVTDDLNMVTESFVRVNTQGKQMAEVNIIYALLFADWKLEEKLNAVKTRLIEVGWQSLSDDDLLTVLKVLLRQDIYRTTPRELAELLKKNTDLDGLFEEIAKHLRTACEVLNALGFRGPASLPYRAHLLGVFECVRQPWWPTLPDGMGNRLLHTWLLRTAYAETFSGITSLPLRKHLDELIERVQSQNLDDFVRGVVTPIQRFNYATIRGKLFTQCLISSLPAQDRLEAQERLGREGSDAVDVIFPAFPASRPGNRIVLPFGHLTRLREAIKSPLSGTNPALLYEYLGIEDAAQRIANGQREALLLHRESSLHQLEAALVSQMAGLEAKDE